MTGKLSSKTKRVYALLREDMKEFPETYITMCTGLGCVIAAKGLVEYSYTGSHNGYLVAGLAISTAAIAYELSSLLRKK